MNCLFCRSQLPQEARACPNCGNLAPTYNTAAYDATIPSANLQHINIPNTLSSTDPYNPSSPQMANHIGQQVGNYSLVRLLGQGGSAEVYLGEHIHLGTLAAIKFLHTELSEYEKKSFLIEARIVARLVHPNIVRVLDFGVEGYAAFLVMDYAPNGTLSQHHLRGTPVPLADVLTYVKQVATALQYAHDRKLIHRDVKPANMLLGLYNEVWLGDFGIAIAAHNTVSQIKQQMVGTVRYMAPEQIQGQASPASDQYALAVVVYEWLSGAYLFDGASPIEIAIYHLTNPVPPLREKFPMIPSAVEAVVLKALAKDQKERFANVLDFAHALEQASQVNQSEQPATIGSRFVSIVQDLNATEEFLALNATEESSDEGEKTVFPDFRGKISSIPSVPIPPPEKQDLAEDAAFVTNANMNSMLPEVPSYSISPQSLKQRLSFGQNIAELLEEGENHYKAKRYEEALVIYSLSIQLDPQEVRAQGNKGNVLGRLGRYEEALAAYNDALAIDPKHVSIWNAKGDMLSKLKRYEEAVVAYTSALALNPKDALTWATKGDMLSKLKRYEEALVAYYQCLDVDSKNVLVWISKGNILSKLKRDEEALVAYDSALALNPKNALTWTLKGKLLSKLERYEEALVAYTCASDIAPRRALIWAAKGEVLSQLKRYEEALVDYERACILNPTDIAIARKCDLLRDLKHHKEELARAQVSDQLNTKVFTYQDPSAHHNSNEQHPPSFSKEQKAIDLPKQEVPALKHQGINKLFKQEQEGTMLLERFDVFLSYSHADAQWVENLAKRLEDEHHFRVWLDRWRLIPGQSWQPELARALGQANSCAVCIGEQTPVGWFKQEIQKALDRQTKDPDFRVFAVLLPNAKDISDDFLQSNTWVDFRNEDSTYAFHRLASGVKGEPPGRWAPSEAESVKTTIIVEDMLSDLHRLRQTNLITDAIKEEYMRLAMEKVWFVQWTLKIKDDTNE